MKKLSMVMSAMACAALVLSGCGNSVSDDRAEAYASLSSMTSLSTSQAQEYKQRLTVPLILLLLRVFLLRLRPLMIKGGQTTLPLLLKRQPMTRLLRRLKLPCLEQN